MDSNPTLNWINSFLKNPNWKHLKFKKLKSGYPQFDFPDELVDEVDLEEFISEDNNRIPLFIGSQFGLYPNPNKIFYKTNESLLLARLDKSLLSGHVSGLSICYLKKGKLHEIEFFKN